MFDERKYVIIPTSEINNINFDQVLESSADTCRYSVDGSQTFVKYQGEMPSSVAAVENAVECTHAEILEILRGEEWTEADDGVAGA